MRLTVFGATGRTGRCVVEQALAEGHEVVAAVRRPQAMHSADRLEIRRCDVSEADAVTSAMSGGDVVVSCIGPASNRHPGTVISDGVRHLIAGCTANGIARFVFQDGLMVGDGREFSVTGRMQLMVAGRLFTTLRADKVRAEAAITNCSLEWVIVRAPFLRDRSAPGVIAGPAARVTPAKSISYADCAATLLKAATTPDWTRRIVNVGRP